MITIMATIMTIQVDQRVGVEVWEQRVDELRTQLEVVLAQVHRYNLRRVITITLGAVDWLRSAYDHPRGWLTPVFVMRSRYQADAIATHVGWLERGRGMRLLCLTIGRWCGWTRSQRAAIHRCAQLSRWPPIARIHACGAGESDGPRESHI
eukprot:COSAG01_NODE_5646_length_4119_cov_7.726119_2_plen_151_part_00